MVPRLDEKADKCCDQKVAFLTSNEHTDNKGEFHIELSFTSVLQ